MHRDPDHLEYGNTELDRVGGLVLSGRNEMHPNPGEAMIVSHDPCVRSFRELGLGVTLGVKG